MELYIHHPNNEISRDQAFGHDMPKHSAETATPSNERNNRPRPGSQRAKRDCVIVRVRASMGGYQIVFDACARTSAWARLNIVFFSRSRQPCRSRVAHRDVRAPRSAQREAARASGLSERQHVVQARFAGSGAFGDQPRRSQGRAANGVLHCSRQHAPPPACPGRGGSSSEGWWRPESPDPDELSDKRLRVGVPAPSDLNSKDEEAVAAAALQLRG